MLENISSGGSQANTISVKSIIRISGKLILPVEEGARAVILYGGELIRTSRVTKVFEQSEYMAYFETQRHIYKVSLVPNTNAVQIQKEYAKCA